MSHSILFNLTDELWSGIFNFLSLVDLARYETALSARILRNYYLNQLADRDSDQTPPLLEDTSRNNFLPWLVQRRLSVTYWTKVFNHSLGDEDQVKKFFLINGANITDVDGGPDGVAGHLLQQNALLMFCVIEACPDLRTLTINSACSHFLVGVIAKCPNVETLHIHDTIFDIHHAHTVAWGWRNLSVLTFGHASQVSNDCLITLSKSCFKLVHLDCRHSETISDEGLMEIAKMCPLLKVVKALELSANVLLEIIKNSKQFSSFEAGLLVANDAQFKAVMSCGTLKTVSWGEVTELTVRSYSELKGMKCLHLEHEDDEMTDEVVMGIAERNPDLEEVYLISRNLTEASAVVLSQQCPNLRYITLSNDPDLTEDVIFVENMVPGEAFAHAEKICLCFAPNGMAVNPLLV